MNIIAGLKKKKKKKKTTGIIGRTRIRKGKGEWGGQSTKYICLKRTDPRLNEKKNASKEMVQRKRVTLGGSESFDSSFEGNDEKNLIMSRVSSRSEVSNQASHLMIHFPRHRMLRSA